MQYKTEAVLLDLRDLGESNKLVTLLTKDYGKISAVAYGARTAKSRLAGALQLFTYADLVLMPGKSLDTIKQCDVINHFRRLREDLVCLAYGAFLAELACAICPERQPEPVIFQLLLDTFPIITERNPRIVALAGAWQLLSAGGYKPELKCCAVCGKQLAQPSLFKIECGGSVCAACKSEAALLLNESIWNFMEVLLSLDFKNPGSFCVTGNVLMQTEQLLMQYLNYFVEKRFKSLEFIKNITEIK